MPRVCSTRQTSRSVAERGLGRVIGDQNLTYDITCRIGSHLIIEIGSKIKSNYKIWL